MSKTGWIIFTVAVLAILGSLVAWTRISNPPLDVSGVEHDSIIAASDLNGNIGDHVIGKADSKIRLIEYGDFQCPGCGSAAPNVKTLIDEYGDDVAFVFRNFPLTSIHPNAKAAAAVAEAAGLQGKYWEMNFSLYDNQRSWSSLDAKKRTEVFAGYASSLGLNMEKFNTDIASAEVAKKITFDMAIGKKADVSATPTFFLQGEQLDGDISNQITQGNLETIREKINSLIKK